MAIRRTAPKSQTQAQSTTGSFTYRLPTDTTAKANLKSVRTASAATELFGYPVALIYQDIIKTVVLSTFTLVILGVITYLLRYR